ncbi:MAG: hypothetical protein ACTSRN_01025 [Alphaproteobacteria bacterium]
MSVKHTSVAILALGAFTLSACTIGYTDQDYGVDEGSLTSMAAGIWIDGNGCDHWIIDDGLEGYMSPRFGPEGKPVCRDGSVPYSTVDFERSLIGL